VQIVWYIVRQQKEDESRNAAYCNAVGTLSELCVFIFMEI
jgi:hypothetical protein